MRLNPGSLAPGPIPLTTLLCGSIILALFPQSPLWAGAQARLTPYVLKAELHFADEKAQTQWGTRKLL